MIYAGIVSDIGKYLQDLGNPWARVQTLDVLIPNLINLALVVAVVVFFFLLLLGGIQWITSAGDKESLAKAQRKITAALVGIIIVFSAWAIKSLVWYFFGLNKEGGGLSGGNSSGQLCFYCENCDGSLLKTRQCRGTIQNGVCRYNENVDPECPPSSCKLCGDGNCDVCEGPDWCPQDCH